MLYLLFILCCICVVWRYFLRKATELEPPEMSGKLPIIGHALMFVTNDNYEIIVKASEECSKRGGIITTVIVTLKVYVVTDPEAFLEISNECIEKGYAYNFLKPFLGESLLTADVSTWKRHRKLLNPAFSQQVLNSFINTFNTQARILVDQLAFQLGKPFDHGSLLKQNNFKTTCQTTTGVGVDGKISNGETYVSLVAKFQECFNERLRKVWLHSDFIFNMSNLKRKQDIFSKQFFDISNSIVQKKKVEMKSAEKNTSKFKPVLQLMLEKENINETQYFTDKEIRDETNTIISAGHETTSTALNILLIVLGSYPHVQERVYNEVIQVCGGSERDFDKDDLPKLVYTEAVLKESMRLYPVAPFIGRSIHKDTKIKNYTLKRGNICFLSIYGLNHHPIWGSDADQFKPERWLDASTLPNMNCYGTFAIGKRNCIGKAYAIMLMKTNLAHLIRRYRISADISKLRIHWHFTTYPSSGHHYTLKRRD